jgi:hypothetical protein
VDAARGVLIGGPQTAAFGDRPVSARGVFMDYDGQPQASPDITTRGIMLLDRSGCVITRYYLNVFPDLSSSGALGSAKSAPASLPARPCSALVRDGVPELQPGAADAAGIG